MNTWKTGSLIGFLLTLCLFAAVGCDLSSPLPKKGKALSYHFNQPAQIWEESFPLGNGRIGLMPDGGIEKERLLLNEISLWSGSKQDADNPQAAYSLNRIRQLLFQGRNDEAQELMYQTFVCKGAGSGLGDGATEPYGSYQLLGYLTLDYTYNEETGATSAYRRELNLNEATATVAFKQGDIHYKREAFTSFSHDVGVVHLTADVDKALNFTVGMERPECFAVTADGNELVMTGQLSDGVDTVEMKGMRYEARVRVLLPKGGTLESSGTTIQVSNASEAVLLVGMATDYFDKAGYAEELVSLLQQAERTDYATLRREHLAAYKKLFDRATLDLGDSEREELPMDERLRAFYADKNDPSLAALYFQFGRYLLISSTRPGSLPPNLQGLWCNTIHTPWNGDYHLNINLQMNLWPAEVTNLSELHLPMIEWTKQQVESGRKTAKAFYNARGWVTHILGNVWEFTAPGEHPSWGSTNTSAAWLCEHLYTHYLYTMDKSYLAEVYPVMKEAALFFVDILVKDPRSGYLVTAPTTSPENSFILPNGNNAHICAGSTMDNQILRELFSNTIAASELLEIDREFAQLLKEKRAQLMPTTIADDGRIMEWLEPFEEAEPTHRHVSHLYGLHPANEIDVVKTPALAEAAKKTLLGRGDKSTGWSMAWKINFWARLRDGDHALLLLSELLRPGVEKGGDMMNDGGSYPNLFCGHPPFQIDGNFGGCAGIAEMLLQCQAGYIEYLPALPSAWQQGSFTGLKVIGGGEVSAKWNNGALTEATLKATVANHFRIKLPVNSAALQLSRNNNPISLPVIDGFLSIDLAENEELRMSF